MNFDVYIDGIEEGVDDAERERGSLSEYLFVTTLQELAQALKTEQAQQTRHLIEAMECHCKSEWYEVVPDDTGKYEGSPLTTRCNRCKKLEELS